MNGGSFASVALLSGKSGADIRDKVSRDVAPTWLTGVCYWPFVMALTFRVVPLRHRALSSAGFGAVWHIYLSSQANKAQGGKRAIPCPSHDGAPSACLDHPKAQTAPTLPGAPPPPLGGVRWPQEPASARAQAEESLHLASTPQALRSSSAALRCPRPSRAPS